MPSNPAARARMETNFLQVASAVAPSMVDSDGDGGGLRCGCIDVFDFFLDCAPDLLGRDCDCGVCVDVDEVVGTVMVVAAAVSASTGPRGCITAMMSDMAVLADNLFWTRLKTKWVESETAGLSQTVAEIDCDVDNKFLGGKVKDRTSTKPSPISPSTSLTHIQPCLL